MKLGIFINIKRPLISHVIIGLALSILTCGAMGKSCLDLVPQIAKEFEDSKGKLGTLEVAQLKALTGCAAKYQLCVTTDHGDPNQFVVVGGTSISELEHKGKEDSASNALTYITTKRHGEVCVLIRYSGGSASAWMLRAWRLGSRVPVRLRTEQVVIQAEVASPAEVVRMAVTRLESLP